MNDLWRGILVKSDADGYRAREAVQIVVRAGVGGYDQGCGISQQIQALDQCLLKKVFDSFNSYLGIVQTKLGGISLWYNK